MNYEKIGKFIQEKRKEKKLTQKNLADLIGVTDKAVSKWERGMGCPDISIIEELSKSLDTTILEILKGEEITNREVDNQKANEYVKYALDYSFKRQKEKRKKFIENLVFSVIIFISLVLIILNIESVIRLNKKYISTVKIDHDLVENYVQVRKNLSIIENNQGIFSDNDYQIILDDIKNIEKYLKYNKILHTNNQIQLTKEELYMCYSNTYYGYLTLKVLKNYNNSLDYVDYINIFDLGKSSIYESNLLNSYKYNWPIGTYYDDDVISYNADDALFRTEISLENYINLTNLIIKVGELDE